MGSPVGTASPIVAADGTIYVGSHGGRFTAFDPTGNEKWRLDLPGTIEGSAAIDAAGTIYVGCNDARLRTVSPDGLVVSTTLLRSSVSGILLDADGTAYVSASDAKGYAVRDGIAMPAMNLDFFGIAGTRLLATSFYTFAFAAAPIPKDAGLWHLLTAGQPVCANASGAVVVKSGQQIRMVDATGVALWSAHVIPESYYSMDSPPPIHCAVAADGTTRLHVLDTTYAIDPSGEIRWTFRTALMFGAIAIDAEGISYFGDDDGRVHALDADGKALFALATGGPVRSSPAIGADGTLYVGSDDGFLWAVSP